MNVSGKNTAANLPIKGSGDESTLLRDERPLKLHFEKSELKARKQRIEDIASGNVVGDAAREAIEAVQAAMIATSAAITAATTATIATT